MPSIDIDPRLTFWIFTITNILLAIAATLHILLNKREPRSATAWIGFVWMAPIFGTIFYFLFGINRINRALHRRLAWYARYTSQPLSLEVNASLQLPGDVTHLGQLATYVSHISDLPLLGGNAVKVLVNGDQAYPEMLAAIDQARKNIDLGTYIFDNDTVGKQFVNALTKAVKRGVSVRVLVDGLGLRYSWPPITLTLKKANIPHAVFLPTFLPKALPYMNLRNHRKLLIIDHGLAFTGGMNLREEHVVASCKQAIQDIHFRLAGPIVLELLEAFSKDWLFSTKAIPSTSLTFPGYPEHCGSVWARVISDGPDEDFERTRWIIHGAIANAKRSIHIMTPYFVPDTAMIHFLSVAALGGVTVELMLPRLNNLKVVQWASLASLRTLLERRCKIYLSAPPFNHSKIFVVDSHWAFFGSSNWDARSLRLNFELNVEAYDHKLATELIGIFKLHRAQATELTLENLQNLPVWKKVRNSTARLFAPYL